MSIDIFLVSGKLVMQKNANNSWLFRGYKTWLSQHSGSSRTTTLPGLTATSDEQLFFIGFARAYCSTSKRKAAELSLAVDPHSPNHVRVNVAVTNFPEFSAAFKCGRNSRHNLPQTKRCSLW